MVPQKLYFLKLIFFLAEVNFKRGTLQESGGKKVEGVMTLTETMYISFLKNIVEE